VPVNNDVDRQSQLFWAFLAIVGALLGIAGWAQLLFG
jgi:hypothetical protein